MTDPIHFRYRIYFQKKGRLALLSHLEVARAIERAVRRAELPYAISQGFSPHMKIGFGAALPVRVGGLRECFDLQLTEYRAPDRITAALQEVSVEDLMVLSAEPISNREPAASVAYPFSTYKVVLSDAIDSVNLPESITVVRKKKERELIVNEFLIGSVKHEGAALEFTLWAKPTGSLRPDILIKSILEDHSGVHPLTITRVGQMRQQ